MGHDYQTLAPADQADPTDPIDKEEAEAGQDDDNPYPIPDLKDITPIQLSQMLDTQACQERRENIIRAIRFEQGLERLDALRLMGRLGDTSTKLDQAKNQIEVLDFAQGGKTKEEADMIGNLETFITEAQETMKDDEACLKITEEFDAALDEAHTWIQWSLPATV